MDNSHQSRDNQNNGPIIIFMEAHDDAKTLEQEGPDILDAERKFIMKLEKLPVLWDSGNPNYTNKYKRLEALQQLLNIYKRLKPGANINDVRRKINTLRSNYRRELRKIIRSKNEENGDCDIYKPKNWTFEYLEFLRPIVHMQTQPSSHKQEKADSSNCYDLMQTELRESLMSNEESPNKLEPSSPTQDFSFGNVTLQPTASVTPRKIVKKKSRVVKQKELVECARSYLSMLQTNSTHPQSPKQCSSLASVWSEKLEKLDPMQKLFAEKAINDILFEAELGNLDKYSVRINEPTMDETITEKII